MTMTTDHSPTDFTDLSTDDGASGQARHDWTDSTTLLETIIDALVDLDGAFDALSAPPIQEAIDVDSLETLIESTATPETGFPGRVTFRYDTYRITVTGERVVVQYADQRNHDT